jgi:DNA-binding MarR family transcriptional regulator
MQVLRRLVDRPMSVRELQEASGLAFDAFASTLKSLQDAGYVEVGGKPSEEVVQLTDEGRKVAQIALS